MRCKKCNYSLWSLAVRECPECGTGFLPSEYEFVPQTVQFCCPQCRQAYAGTDDRGHLSPRSFVCEKCSAAIDMDAMVLSPAEGLTDADTTPGVMPWLERRKRGVIKAFLMTIGLALVMPPRLFRGVPVSASVGEALVFGGAITALAYAVGIAIPYIGFWAYQYVIWGFGGPDMWELLYMAVWAVIWFFAVAGIIPLWALSSHAVLRLTGGSRYSVDRTLQAFCYSAGANIISAIPFVGWMLGVVWWSIGATTMLITGQKVHFARAIAAVYTLPVIGAVVLGGLYFLATYWMYQQWAAGPGGTTWAGVQHEANAIHHGLMAYALAGDQAGPEHGLELVINGNVMPWGYIKDSPYCHTDTKTWPTDVPLAEGTLDTFITLSTTQQQGVLGRVVEAWPDNVIAHRVGDFVFLYHGYTFTGADPDLWTAVMIPDPDVNGTPPPAQVIIIATDDATNGVIEITYDDLADELASQNGHRASYDLPPLPDLLTLTHDEPAVAP